jgi:hypothetical protein
MHRAPSAQKRIRAVVLAAVALAASGCGLGERQRYADLLGMAPAAAAEAGTAHVRITADASLSGPNVESKTAASSAVTLEGWVDFGARRAELAVAGSPVLMVDGLTWYARRADALPDEARPWISFRADQLEKHAHAVDPAQFSPLLGAATIPTSFLVDLVAGSLAGSMSETSSVAGGRPLREYAGNFDIDKALKKTKGQRYSDHDREQMLNVLGFLGVAQEPHHGRAWIDSSGRPVRFMIDLLEKPRRLTTVHLKLDVTLDRYGRHPLRPRPKDDELVEVGSGNEFLTVLAGQLTAKPVSAAKP